MARCGCTSSCACSVTVVDTSSVDLTIIGDGSQANPYVISGVASSNVNHANTPCIKLTGTGSVATPLTATPVIDPDPANALSCRATGLFTAGTQICFGDSDCIGLAGSGTVAAPVIATPVIAALPCNGLKCTATGLAVAPSSDAGNNLTCGTDGKLFVPTGAATVATGPCGVTGDGSGGNPIQAKVSTWAFPCAQGAATAGKVYCDPASGVLQTDPPPASLSLPAGVGVCAGAPGFGNYITSGILTINNPSTCFPLNLNVEPRFTFASISGGATPTDYNFEVSTNGGPFAAFENGTIPSALGGAPTFTSQGINVNQIQAQVPAGGSITYQFRYRLVSADPNAAWFTGCVGATATGTAP